MEKSLLRAAEGPGGDPRFALLETLREYALERLEQSGEGERARGRHSRHYLALAETAGPGLAGPRAERGRWLDRLEVEHDNLRQALAWTRPPPHPQRTGARWACGWPRAGPVLATERPLERGAAVARRRARAARGGATDARAGGGAPGRRHPGGQAGRVRRRARAAGSERHRVAHAGGPPAAGGGAQRVDLAPAERQRLRRAARAAVECAWLWRELGDRPGLARALRWLGHAIGTRPEASPAERREAEALWGESLALFRELGDDAGASEPLFMLAWLAGVRGDYAALPGRTSNRPWRSGARRRPGGLLL